MSGLALVCHRLGARVTGSRPRRELLPGAAAGGRARAAGRPRRRRGPAGRRGRRLDRDRRRQPRARAGARARPAGDPPRRAARRALRREAPDRRRRDPRQDDHGRDARPRAARDGRRPGLPPRRRAARAPARTAAPRTPAGATASGSSPRPTSPTPASCGCGPRSRWSPTSSSTTTRAGPRAPSCSRRSARFCEPAARPGAARRRRASTDARRRASGCCASTPTRPGPALELRVPGRHNLLNARAALAALELAGFDARAGGARRSPRFPGMLRRLELKGDRDGRRDLRRLRPPPDRGRRDARGAARARARAG